MADPFDALVVGAGPAGSALALSLVRRGLKVGLFESATQQPRRVGETLPGVAAASLTQLGLWHDFLKQGHQPACALRSSWQSAEPSERLAIFDRHGAGFHLDRVRFDRWLVERAVAAGATLLSPTKVQSVARSANGAWQLTYLAQAGRRLAHAPLLADATGARAWLARKLGAQLWYAQRLVGVARWFSCAAAEPVTLVEAAPDGYFYSAPVPGGALVAVWIGDARSPAVRAGKALGAWQAGLNASPLTAARLAEARALGEPNVRLTGPMLTCGAEGAGFLSVGDAACRFDPIAGEGIVFALRSALDAATVLLQPTPGSDALRRYRAGVVRAFRDHLSYRSRAYAAVERFADRQFWRQGRAAVGPDFALNLAGAAAS